MTLPAEPIFDDDDNSGGRGGQGGIDLDFNVVKDVGNFWKIFWLTSQAPKWLDYSYFLFMNPIIQISKYPGGWGGQGGGQGGQGDQQKN